MHTIIKIDNVAFSSIGHISVFAKLTKMYKNWEFYSNFVKYF